ncbi:unnamed protein product [Linum trigynum]|uniref:Uncharacterized protein n=1 Tax=Linum trigynum TaxID=586398 RepID=A0AAV2CFJ1_9ROSI
MEEAEEQRREERVEGRGGEGEWGEEEANAYPKSVEIWVGKLRKMAFVALLDRAGRMRELEDVGLGEANRTSPEK